MSGGSLDYVYSRVEEAARTLMATAQDEVHRAFAKHLFEVSNALYCAEYVLSGDSKQGSDHKAILRVITPAAVLASLIDDAEQMQTQLQEWIVRAKGEQK
jgi:hypothetical protein